MVLTLMAHSGVSAAPVPAVAHATRASTIAQSRRVTRFVLITTPPWTPPGVGFRGLVGLVYARLASTGLLLNAQEGTPGRHGCAPRPYRAAGPPRAAYARPTRSLQPPQAGRARHPPPPRSS